MRALRDELHVAIDRRTDDLKTNPPNQATLIIERMAKQQELVLYIRLLTEVAEMIFVIEDPDNRNINPKLIILTEIFAKLMLERIRDKNGGTTIQDLKKLLKEMNAACTEQALTA